MYLINNFYPPSSIQSSETIQQGFVSNYYIELNHTKLDDYSGYLFIYWVFLILHLNGSFVCRKCIHVRFLIY